MKPGIDPFGDETITLRLAEERDLAAILDWRNRDDARIWFKTSDKLTMAGHRAWYEQYLKKDDDFCFVVEAEGQPVGLCGIYGIDRANGTAEVGRFLVAPGHGRKGYMTRSCAALARFGMEALELTHLTLEVMESNHKAIGIYLRCGFTEEARFDGLIRMGLRRNAQS
jgi:RimJ/RimL family protein N-acetyltransferase